MIDVVCGVIQNETGRFLACQRPEGKHLGGLWEFPGGKVVLGESPERALVRELREELGVEVAVGAAFDPVIWSYDLHRIRLLPFQCRITGGQLRAIEHSQLLWLTADKFDTLPWSDADVPILEQIRIWISQRASGREATTTSQPARDLD